MFPPPARHANEILLGSFLSTEKILIFHVSYRKKVENWEFGSVADPDLASFGTRDLSDFLQISEEVY
jgi:hypothetical protein